MPHKLLSKAFGLMKNAEIGGKVWLHYFKGSWLA